MTTISAPKLVRCALGFAALMATISLPAQQPTAAERVAQFKATLAASQVVLRQYEWIQTTVVAVDDQEKSRKQERCFYGADGKETRVLLTPPAPDQKKRGLRGRIAQHQKEELADYMKEAVGLVKQYLPPSPAKIQEVKDAGKVTAELTPQKQRARLTFKDYLKAGDSLAVDVDLSNNRPLSANVNTYLDTSKEPVTLAVQFGSLADQTVYPSDVVLQAPGKKLKVTVQNSGYRKSMQ